MEDFPCSWIDTVNVIERATLSKPIYRLQCNFGKNTHEIHHRKRKKS